MERRSTGGPLIIGLLAVALLLWFGVAFGVTFLFPQLQLVGIIIACLVAIGVAGGARLVVGSRWVAWTMFPAVALAGIGVMMMSEDLALTQDGELTEVVIADHTVDVTSRYSAHSRAQRKAYTHEYTLNYPNGQRIDRPMVYRGKDGFDGVDTGDTITVLIDPEGKAPTRPAESVNIEAGLGLSIVGVVAAIGALSACALVLLLRRSSP